MEAEAQDSGETPLHSRMSAMQELVRGGQFREAEEAGCSERPCLGMRISDVQDCTGLPGGSGARLLAGFVGGERVVVKKPVVSVSEDLERFRKELQTMAACQGHDGVIAFLGARLLPPDYFLVVRRYERSVADAIYEDGWRPGLGEALTLMQGVADAMAHVHSKRVLHRDIKPANVLLGASASGPGAFRVFPVIADFGIAEFEDALWEEYTSTDASVVCGRNGFYKRFMVGTLEYMSPEILMRKSTHTRACDVYAWSVMANEVITGRFPFSDCTTENPKAHTILEMGYGRQELAAAVVSEGLRPILSPTTPDAMLTVLDAGWHEDPAQRPTFEAISRDVLALARDAPDTLQCSAYGMAFSADDALPSTGKDAVEPGELEPGEHAHGADAVSTHDSGSSWLDLPLSISGYMPTLSSGSFITPGMRGADHMEDTIIIDRLGMTTPPGGPEREPDVYVFGVFDGHRGDEASKFMEESFVAILKANVHRETPGSALAAAFEQCESQLRTSLDDEWRTRVRRMGAEAAGLRPFPGTTAIAMLIRGDTLAVANCGDCRAILCRGGDPLQLSTDHTASDPEERRRLESLGFSVVHFNGNPRVPPAMIEVTRSIGDYDMKEHGLSAEADTVEIRLEENDEFIVMGSDGLFEYLSNEEIVGLVHDTVKDAQMCSKRLVTEAMMRGTTDNVSCIVAFVSPCKTLERIYAKGEQKYKYTSTYYSSRDDNTISEATMADRY